MSKHNWEYVWETPFELSDLDKPEELAETVWRIASGFPVHYGDCSLRSVIYFTNYL